MAEIIMNIAMGIILLSMALTFLRFVLGPDTLSRTVSFDALTIMSLSLILYIAQAMGRMIYIDIALVYALLSFIGVIAIAGFYAKRGKI